MRNFKKTVAFFLLIFLAACSSSGSKKMAKEHYTDHFIPRHSTQFEVFSYSWGYKIIVKDPWKTNAAFGTYAIVKPDSIVDAKDFDAVVQQPVTSIAALSSTHIGLLTRLGCDDLIKGSLSAHGVCNERLRERYRKGDFINLGEAMSPNMENIINLQPDVIIKSAFQDVQKSDDLLFRADISVVYTADWMENSMLGRAEWIRFYGFLLNKEHEADSIFKEIEKEYLTVKSMARTDTTKMSLLPGIPFKNTWYMAGGKSYRGSLFNDAGVDYYYANDTTTGSKPLNIESVLNHQLESDVWIDINTDSKIELLGIDSRFANFKAFKTDNLYSMRGRVSPEGNNDYWESGIAYPEIVLKDLVKITHPALLPNHQLFYYKQLR